MKKAARIIGWVCFVIAAVIYLVATFYFGAGFVSAFTQAKDGDGVGIAALVLVFAVVGTIIYAVDAGISLIGTLVSNIKRGERKVFLPPIVTLILSVVTWLVFLLICAAA